MHNYNSQLKTYLSPRKHKQLASDKTSLQSCRVFPAHETLLGSFVDIGRALEATGQQLMTDFAFSIRTEFHGGINSFPLA